MAFWHHVVFQQQTTVGIAIVGESSWHNLITAIHSSGKQAVIAITGGGSAAVGRLLEVPGGSRSVIEAVVPYASSALTDLLGGKPDQYCSEPTARAMAMAAWMRARKLSHAVDPLTLVGIGVTASLVSDVPKRGDHRIHVAWQTAGETCSQTVTLNKGIRIREHEERIAADLVLLALAEACGVDASIGYSELQKQFETTEQIQRLSQVAEPEWTKLLLGETRCVLCGGHAQSMIVFPGAFNPLHQGHRKMARIAVERLGSELCYEISLANVDKPSLDFVEIQNRITGIQKQDPGKELMLTSAPTFREKAELVPNATFVVGVDTLVRIADPKYYGNDATKRDQAIADIAAAGCRFLVFGRTCTGEFQCLSNVEIPATLRAICDEVPANEFREDIASTALRNR